MKRKHWTWGPMSVWTNLKSDGRMTMDDTYVQPCLQESEQWPQIYDKIERQRSRLEEFAYFEKEVEARAKARRNMAPNLPKCELDEKTQMHGLCQHGKAPSILEHGITEQVDYAKFHGNIARIILVHHLCR